MPREIHPFLAENEFTLDDVVLPPTNIPCFEPTDVNYSVQLTEKIKLKRPIIGSPMDTVTGSKMAILLAKMGGIGVIHSGQSIDEQVEEVRTVRRWEAGFVLEPKVLGPDATIEDLLRSEEKTKITSYPITKDGTLQSSILGIVTERDIRNKREPRYYSMPVTQVMTPKERLVYALKKDTLDINNIRAANTRLRDDNLDTLLILDENYFVHALVTRSDLKKDIENPFATKDSNKQLEVYAAVESRFIHASKRIEALANSGVAGIVIDSRNIYGDYHPIAKFAKEKNPTLDVIVGNIVHPSVLEEVLEKSSQYIDGFRVGIGTGEVCITTEELSIGRGMGSALLSLDAAYKKLGGNNSFGHIGFIPDGGIKFPKHFVIAASLIENFSGVMLGSVLAGYAESPTQEYPKSAGVYVKRVRGMGSVGAISARAGGARYGSDKIEPSKRYAEGIEKEVPFLGKGQPYIEKYFEGVRTAMHALGAENISQLYDDATLYPISKAASKGTL